MLKLTKIMNGTAMRYIYKTKDVCATEISFKMNNDKSVSDINFKNGCEGNLKTISLLLNGKKADEIISLCRFNTCENKPTSCTDQLAIALETNIRNMEK